MKPTEEEYFERLLRKVNASQGAAIILSPLLVLAEPKRRIVSAYYHLREEVPFREVQRGLALNAPLKIPFGWYLMWHPAEPRPRRIPRYRGFFLGEGFPQDYETYLLTVHFAAPRWVPVGWLDSWKDITVNKLHHLAGQANPRVMIWIVR